MWTKDKHNINGACLKLAVLLTAGVIACAINPTGAWAQVPQQLDAGACSALQNSNVVVFVVDQTGNYRTYYGKATGSTVKHGPWFNAKNGVNIKTLQAIGVAVNNPEYCYTWNGNAYCVEYSP